MGLCQAFQIVCQRTLNRASYLFCKGRSNFAPAFGVRGFPPLCCASKRALIIILPPTHGESLPVFAIKRHGDAFLLLVDEAFVEPKIIGVNVQGFEQDARWGGIGFDASAFPD